ncbi:hypothetical protein LQF76_05900 [Gloeomargaritales cyanobacterium VI4D9]|nr:hypothetical protein LQF76_05900 [Gloeomargaritales cyanobacterium VI4D9]
MLDRGLDDLQRRAADLVLDGWPLSRISSYLEVSKVSLCKWKKLPAWKEYLAEQTGEGLEARSHRVRRVCDLALETIESALVDPEIVPLKRAELAIKWLTLIRESVTQAATPAPTEGRVLNQDVIRQIREKIYGIADPKLPNTPDM